VPTGQWLILSCQLCGFFIFESGNHVARENGKKILVKRTNKLAARKPKVNRFAQPAAESVGEQTEAGNVGAPSEPPSYEALVRMMNLTVRDFQSAQTHEDPNAAELVRKGLAGDFRAIKKITDIVDGRVSRRRPKRDE